MRWSRTVDDVLETVASTADDLRREGALLGEQQARLDAITRQLEELANDLRENDGG